MLERKDVLFIEGDSDSEVVAALLKGIARQPIPWREEDEEA